MEVHRDPYGPYADRINHVLDHVFGMIPNLSSDERSKTYLQLLAEEFNKMTQRRKIRNSQLSVSDNGSSSPNDHLSMVKTPEDGQHYNQWHPEVMYRHNYTHDLPPIANDDGWWPIPVQQGMLCNSIVPLHDDYGYGMDAGHV